jgi:hypothetical protein
LYVTCSMKGRQPRWSGPTSGKERPRRRRMASVVSFCIHQTSVVCYFDQQRNKMNVSKRPIIFLNLRLKIESPLLDGQHVRLANFKQTAKFRPKQKTTGWSNLAVIGCFSFQLSKLMTDKSRGLRLRKGQSTERIIKAVRCRQTTCTASCSRHSFLLGP